MHFLRLYSVRHAMRHSAWLWFVVLLAACEAVLQSVLPNMLRHIIDAALGAHPRIHTTDIPGMIVVYTVIAVSIPLLNWAGTVLASWSAWSATNALRDLVGAHLFAHPLEFFRTHGIGELSERIDADPGQLHQVLGTSSANLVRMTVLLGAVAYGTWTIDPRLSLVLVGYAVCAGLVLAWIQRHNAADWEAERVADAALYDNIEENFASVLDVRAVGGEDALPRRLTPRLTRLLSTHRSARINSERAAVVSGLMMLSGWALALGIGSWRVVTGQGTIGEAVALLGFIGLLGTPIEHLRTEVQAFQQALGSFRRIDDLMQSELPQDTATPPPPTQLEVRLEQVRFRYATSTDWVIRDISMQIAAGSHVALIGRTGSGKSTLLRLLSGLETPTHGQLFLNGTPMTAMPNQQLRHWVGVISQESDVFNATLRDNFTCFADTFGDTQIWHAIQTLQLTEWMQTFVAGLDTPIGDGERMLSPGEEQLVAFVRLQLRNPRLILLDEASAHIDPLNEQRLNRALTALGHGRTIITIAHRLSTIKTADRIIVMMDGTIQEDGTPAELAQRIDGQYAQFLHHQSATGEGEL